MDEAIARISRATPKRHVSAALNGELLVPRRRHSEVTGCSNLWRPKTAANTHAFRPHCPLGAHVFLVYLRRPKPSGRHHAHSEPVLPTTSVGPTSSPWPTSSPPAMVGLNQGGSFSLSFIAGSSDAGSGVKSTVFSFARSTLSITRRMVSKGIPPSGSVTATFVGMSSPSSRASRASSLMSASAAQGYSDQTDACDRRCSG
jgi:hypothetical protein